MILYIKIFLGVLLSGTSVFGQISQLTTILDKIDTDSTRLISIFKDIHANPELGFMEKRTSGIIEKELRQLGYEVVTGIGKTGVVGVLKNGNGPVVMYRADMDAVAEYGDG